jgi:putative tricarboxylic transport membrane protein
MSAALTIVAPAAPGGGWDQTARVMQQVLARIEPEARVQVENVPGAAGTIGLARFVSAERGNPDALLVTGLVMLSGIITNHAPVALAEATPIARLTGEYEAIVVPAESRWQTLGGLIDAFKAAPASISWGGGSAGGTDDLLVRLIAADVGVPPIQVNYIAFAGGGAALAALLGGQVTAGVSGYAEFAGQIEAGTLRVLAISAPTRMTSIAAPTLREQGIALDLANWRGVVAPPGLTDNEREQLTARVQRMATSAEWQAVLTRNGWADLLLTGTAFRQFLLAEQSRIEQVLRALASQNEAGRPPTSRASRLRLTPMTVPSVAIGGLALLLGAIVARRSRHRRPANRPERPDRLVRSDRHDRPDLTDPPDPADPPDLPDPPDSPHPRTQSVRPAHARRTYFLALILLAHALLMPWVGFVAASTALFTVAARLLGSRRTLRDACIGVLTAALLFGAFTVGLGVDLPVDPVTRWLVR